MKLPKILQHEPLVDAIFEVRLQGSPRLVDILPGFLFHELNPKPSLTRLPAAEIPQPIRANDPALKYAPTQRLDWDQYYIAVGDQNIVISCKLPYPKWPNFKVAILDIINRINKVGIDEQVERYSVKYVNLIKAPTINEQVSKIKMAIQLGDIEVSNNQISLQIHHKEDDIIHILSVAVGAKGTMSDGKIMSGVVVDVDSIRMIQLSDFATFASNLEREIEHLRQANKAKFFGCLTDATIEEMVPIYE